ncbi:MAG: hypothetical protein EBR82_65310 [Caulobacteraceae bacterium]|nr:hypothetical protein [Caulobacteraceae bacterium]
MTTKTAIASTSEYVKMTPLASGWVRSTDDLPAQNYTITITITTDMFHLYHKFVQAALEHAHLIADQFDQPFTWTQEITRNAE